MSNGPTDLPEGTMLACDFGRGKGSKYWVGGTRWYQFGRLLGAGGFGKTYLSSIQGDGQRDETCAIKEYFPVMLNPRRAADGRVVVAPHYAQAFEYGKQSFITEARMLSSVSHIGSVVHVQGYFEANNTAYMVMEYLDGQTLRQVVEQGGRMDPNRIFPMMMTLMDDLAFMHDTGLVHRDIAPDNIMLVPGDTLKLVDFGTARSMEDGRSMTVLVKPGFSPIEQYQRHGQGAYTDVYALCATLYYCLTGVVPPPAPDRLVAVDSGRPDPLVPPQQTGASFSGRAGRILLWGMSLQPGERPQDMRQLVGTIRETFGIAAPVPVPDPPKPVPSDPTPTKPKPQADKSSSTTITNQKKAPKGSWRDGCLGCLIEGLGQLTLAIIVFFLFAALVRSCNGL